MNEFQPTPGTPKEMFRAIRILFGAIITGALIFAIIVLALNAVNEMQKPVSPVKKSENILFVAGLGIVVVCFAIAWTGYNKMITIAKDSLISLTDKLNQYRSALIRYVALCEGPALFGIILFFITRNYLMLVITAIMIAVMLAKAPIRKRVIDDLALDWKQEQELG
jgi:drug/metabolite transporter (DMT)-like permease